MNQTPSNRQSGYGAAAAEGRSTWTQLVVLCINNNTSSYVQMCSLNKLSVLSPFYHLLLLVDSLHLNIAFNLCSLPIACEHI
jgi:hypothetical protein